MIGWDDGGPAFSITKSLGVHDGLTRSTVRLTLCT
jgi:hypothetical protein